MTIEVLFPEICNLYSDLMNVDFLRRSNPDITVVNTSLKDEPLFLTAQPDMIYMGTTTERGQELALEKLRPHRERIGELIDGGALFLITGNATELFCDKIVCEDRDDIPCLGFFPLYAKRQMMNRYNSLYIGRFGDMDIVGFKSQFSHTYGENAGFSLFDTTRGDGINTGTKLEGFRRNNLFGTYLIGPLLLLNPPFAKYIMNLMHIENPTLAFENDCYDVYRSRIEEFSQPERGFTY